MNSKDLNKKYRRIAECAVLNDKENSMSVFMEVLQDESNLFNEIYGSCHTLRTQAVIAVFESFIEVMKQQGVYDKAMVDNFRQCFGGVYAEGRADD